MAIIMATKYGSVDCTWPDDAAQDLAIFLLNFRAGKYASPSSIIHVRSIEAHTRLDVFFSRTNNGQCTEATGFFPKNRGNLDLRQIVSIVIPETDIREGIPTDVHRISAGPIQKPHKIRKETPDCPVPKMRRLRNPNLPKRGCSWAISRSADKRLIGDRRTG
jgi:hypothetical protein